MTVVDTQPHKLGRALCRVAVAIALVAVFTSGGPSPAGAADMGRAPIILVLYGSFTGFSPHNRFHEQMVEAINRGSQRDVEVRAEFFDASIGRSDEYDALVVDYLRQKYPRDRVAVVVGVGARPIELAKKVRSALFPSAGLVYGLADRKRMADFEYGTNTTGVSGAVDISGTVALALQLVPGTTHVALVVGPTPIEQPWYERTAADAQAAAPGVELIKLFGLPKDEMLHGLAALPDHTVVLWVSYFRGPDDDVSIPADVLAEALDASNAPIFGLFDGDFGRGTVGGRIIDIGRQGEETGKLVARIVNGEPADTIPPVHIADNPPAVDWRALQRWKIDPSRLPDDTVISFREPTLWDEYGRYVIAVGLVLLAQTLLIVGLIVQRSRRLRTQKSLVERLHFEHLFSDLSARFVDLPDERIDSALAGGLEEIRAMYDADRVDLVQFGQDSRWRAVVDSAAAEGIELSPVELDPEEFPDFVEHIRRGESLQFSEPDEIPSGITRLREAVRQRGIRSGVVVPLNAAGTTLGCLGILTLREPRTWQTHEATRLKTLADIFANALVRKRASAELHQSEEKSGAVLESIAAQVCVLSRDGRIVAMNDAWRQASGDPSGHLTCLLVGERCPMESGAPAPCANAQKSHLRTPIRWILDGSQPAFSTEYRAAMPDTDDWFLLTVEQFRTPEGGAVMTHQNITSRRRAELEAEQRRQELAHVSRVSTMGELAASIAHELNQPLTGVLTNAQAAVRFLQRDPPGLTEVSEILSDIIEDNRRASEVIRRLRSMLHRGAIEAADVDVNDIVLDVVKLLAGDAAHRGMIIESALAPDLQTVRGDHIQLTQVILNLVVNAMDAMKETELQERRIAVRTIADDRSAITISVADRGPGIEPDMLGRIFQPFFTTKQDGMGMGLSIARTIVEAHGGMLSAVNNPDRGATFFCKLQVSTASD